MATIRKQVIKCKELRRRLVEWIDEHPGHWRLGMDIADQVKVRLAQLNMRTSGEVLMKEMRHAQRLGEIRKRIRKGTRYVEYTSIRSEARGSPMREGGGETPPDPKAARVEAPGLLFDNSSKVHGVDVGRRR